MSAGAPSGSPYSIISCATASASASVGRRSLAPSGSDELIERVRQRDEVVQLARGRGLRRLAEPVDPDRPQPELRRRNDVVEVALRDVDVPLAVGSGAFEEHLPVAMR